MFVMSSAQAIQGLQGKLMCGGGDLPLVPGKDLGQQYQIPPAVKYLLLGTICMSMSTASRSLSVIILSFIFQVAARILGSSSSEGGGVTSSWTARWTCGRAPWAASGDRTGQAAQSEI